MAKRKERKIEVTLFEDDRGFGYEIHVGGKHACSGMWIESSVKAYLKMLEQLLFNSETFHKKCPRPFASDEASSVEANITEEELEWVSKSKTYVP